MQKRGILRESFMKIRISAAFAASVLATPSFAQTSLPADGAIEQVLVTASRVPVDLKHVGSATSVFTRSDIERRQTRYVTDLLRTVPGFAVSRSGGPGSQTQVRVRGAEANHVLVLIDGVRANDPATSDEFPWEQLATGAVERIEIVRGAQSALWGSEAVAAVVNITTRGGRGAASSASTYLEGGSNNSRNIGANGVLSQGAWTVDASAERLDTDGENISRVGTERDGAELTSGHIGLRYADDSALGFQASLRGTDSTSAFDPTDFATGLPGDADRITESGNIIAQLVGTLETHDGNVNWQARAAFFDSEHQNFADGTENSSTSSSRYTVTLQSDITLSDDQALTLALEREDTDFSQRGIATFGDPNQDRSLNMQSAMAEYRHTADSGLSWMLSGRYDNYSDFGNALTGRLSLAYALTDSTRLRGNIGTGQKTPTFIERFGFFADQFVGNPDLDPEQSLSFDIGIDQTLADGALQLEATLYVQELEDEINGFVFLPGTSLATAQNLDNKSERKGIELAADWQITQQISAAASYTYTDATEEDSNGLSVAELRRPEHAGSLSLNMASRDDRLRATLVADYGGTRFDRFFPPFPLPAETLKLDDYWLVELTAHYQVTPAVTLYARGTNLLDADYENVVGYGTWGRAGFVGIKTDFGW